MNRETIVSGPIRLDRNYDPVTSYLSSFIPLYFYRLFTDILSSLVTF